MQKTTDFNCIKYHLEAYLLKYFNTCIKMRQNRFEKDLTFNLNYTKKCTKH